MNILAFLIVFFGMVNLVRMTAFIVGSNLYSLKAKRQAKSLTKRFYPFISVVIPAHNEEQTVLRAVRSVVQSKYPRNKREIIVVDDGSTDRTSDIISNYKSRYGVKNLLLVRQNQQGKAAALNNGMGKHATGELVMCLDSDSYLAPDAIAKMVSHFRDPAVAAASSNVKIVPSDSILNLIQRFEYLICYQMKRAHTAFNIEYIIGGIGSTFRRSVLKEINFYDGNTVTEDIDISMKILQKGNRNLKLVYAADAVAYTESVLSIGDLIIQRFRWKWGRSQTFLKNLNLFFNSDKSFNKGLTYVYLPFAIFSDIAFFLEPLLIGYMFYIVLLYGDLFTALSAVSLISAYLILNVLLEPTVKGLDKLMFALLAPTMYLFFFVLSFVEYVALIKTLVKLPFLRSSIKGNTNTWTHVSRLGLNKS